MKIDNSTLSRLAIVKKDLCSENNDKYWFVENHYSVEAWFVEHKKPLSIMWIYRKKVAR
jgi:hypothetical protein